MKIPHLLLGCAACVSFAVTPIVDLSATLVFTDNFDNSNSTTTNLDTNLAARQGGSYVVDNGTVGYVQTAAGDLNQQTYQLRQDQLQTNLGGQLIQSGRITAYPNANFGSNLSGEIWTASFDFRMELFSTSGNLIASTPFNATDYRFIVDTSVSDITGGATANWDVGVRFTIGSNASNEWAFRPIVVVGGVSTTYSDIEITPVQIGSEWFSQTSLFTLTINEINDTLSLSYGNTSIVSGRDIAGAFGNGDRYTGFSSVRTANAPATTALQHSVDNFALTVVPEPSTYALLICFGLLMVATVRARRSSVERA